MHGKKEEDRAATAECRDLPCARQRHGGSRNVQDISEFVAPTRGTNDTYALNGTGAQASILYALRITFGVVHGVLLTLFSFALALLVPAISHFLFGLFGFVLAPLLSLVLTIFCNACIAYVSQIPISAARILKTAWIPPFGVFCVSLIILPLEMMPSLGFQGPMNTLVATSVCVNCIVTAILQVYAARHVQAAAASAATAYSSSEESAPGSSAPK
jgi:hypothetical protein